MTKAEMHAEIVRLREKCDKRATVLRRLFPDKYPGTFFICGEGGERGANGLPERIHVSPAYGCGWSEIYSRNKIIS